ncbi:MAG TPA: hypothetical protein VK149_04845 [Sideroxyarcus sp.]|nr:hypothetical protein [Sideroxyarcus sp.]
MLIRRASFVCFFTLSMTNALAAAPSASEARRFVAAYRVDETIALVARDAIYEASMQEGPHKQFYACVNSHLTAATFHQLAVEVVQQEFSDAQRLQDAVGFFETETGRKLRDSTVEVLRQRPIRRYAGKPLTQPGDYPISPAEYVKVKEFEKLPAYQDFRRFREAINAIGESPSIQAPLKEVQTTCSSPQKK